jgi:protein TonB
MKKLPLWAPLAVIASVAVNIGLLGLASLLSNERELPQDLTAPIGVSLVNLEAPDVDPQEKPKEPEKPTEQQKEDFTPDLIRPDLGGIHGALDLGVAINLGDLSGQDAGGEFVFEAYELDQPPQVMVRVPPVYPYRAREQGVEGAVQVKMLVETDGTVGQVQILDARPAGVFEDAVIKSVVQWKFTPGKIDGSPVTAWVVTTLRFEF